MKDFKLPWPTDILKSLNQAEVELRCTLSYFGEPDPHAISRNRSDRYSSHRLRFDVRRPGEDDLDAISRINQYASEEDIEDIADRSEEHTSELQSLMRISYAVFCLKK